ncbi:MAG: amidohydrolase family protein [Gemmatimonadetes bacterium]|nr:amidohydrolase family protein [Gemmatimonadota bacterium]
MTTTHPFRVPAFFAALAITFAFGATPANALAQRGGAPPQDVPILIRDVTVIDGTGAAGRAHLDVVLRGGKIASISRTGAAAAPAPDSVIDGRGLFAIPGIIDAHVHMGTGPWDARAAVMRSALMGGVTSVLDLAGDSRATSDLQRAVIAGQIPGPHIYYIALVGGPAFFTDPRVLDASRGYTAGTAPWMQVLTDTTDFARTINVARGTGAMAIKLYAALDSAAVARATAEAHRQGMKVFAHATTFRGLPSDLVTAGADMLTHTPYLVWQGSPRTPDFPARARGDFLGVPAGSLVMEHLLTSMRDRGVALNPTHWVFESQAADSVAAVRTPWMYAVTRRAAELGVRIVSGTDGLYDARRDSLPMIHRELELLVAGAGLTPLQAITSATRNGAWAVGAESVTGTLAVGMAADVVLLGADPSVDIRNTRAVRVVIQDGKVVRPAK